MPIKNVACSGVAMGVAALAVGLVEGSEKSRGVGFGLARPRRSMGSAENICANSRTGAIAVVMWPRWPQPYCGVSGRASPMPLSYNATLKPPEPISGHCSADFLSVHSGSPQILVDRLRRLASRAHRQNHGRAAGDDVAAGEDSRLRGRERVVIRRDVAALGDCQSRRRGLNQRIRRGSCRDDRHLSTA